MQPNTKARLMVLTHSSLITNKEILLSTAQVVSKFTLIWNLGGRGHHINFSKIFILFHCSVPLLNMPLSRHLIQTQYTADRNHHSNKYAKNTNPDNVSLYDGRVYYPNNAEYQEYTRNLTKSAPEVSFYSGILFH